jgi:PAS domain S-box-containing protein
MPWLLPSIIAVLGGTSVLTAVYFYLYGQDRQKFLLVWTAGWAVYLIRFCFMLAMLLEGESAFLNAAYHLSALVSGVLLLWGTHLFLGRRLHAAWIIAAASIGFWIIIAIVRNVPFFAFALPNFLFLGVVYILTGSVLLRVEKSSGGRIVGWAFILWGLHKTDYPFLRPIAWFAPWGYVISSIIELSVAIGMLLVYFQKMKTDLIEHEKGFRDFLENMHLSAVMLNRDGRVTFCNDYLLNLTGWSRNDVLGENWFDIFVPEDLRPAMVSYFAKLVNESSVPLHLENAIVTRRGEQRLMLWDNTLLRKSGGQNETASIGIDVTEHRKLEAQLRHAQKMEAIGTLAGGIAHDFNNILSAIIGYGSILQMKMKADDPLRPNVEHILESSKRASALTHGLLTFSRKQAIKTSPVNLNGVMVRFEKLLRRIIGEDVSIEIKLHEGDLNVLADSGQIEQVLMNLATNARDAMPSGGSLHISTGTVELGQRFIDLHGYGKAGAYALLSVTDSGSGMDEKTVKKMFEPFFTTKEVGKGTGLGLAIVYGIIKQHGGYINVYSEPGFGTIFKIYLPLIKSAVHETQAQLSREIARGTETILLAEDDDSLRAMISGVLREFGYSVIEAKDGREAVHKFNENRDAIHLVLIDVIMPRMNGKAAADEMLRIKFGAKILFQSGYPVDSIQQKGLLGDTDYLLNKPFSPEELLGKVRLILDRP